MVIETRLAADAIGPLAVFASQAERISVGTGVIPIWTRNLALIAQTFATLDLLAPGRVVLGLGAWWDPLPSRVGITRRKPVRAMREVVEWVRMLLSMQGEVTYNGGYVHMDNLYLDQGGHRPHNVKLHIGAMGPQMLRLSGRIANGVILGQQQTFNVIKRTVAQVHRGAQSNQRPLEDIDVMKATLVRLARTKKEAVQQIKPLLALYVAQQPHIAGPTEADPELVQRLRHTIPWPATDAQVRQGAALVSDELVDGLGCYGTPDDALQRLAEYRSPGVTTPIIPQPTKEVIDPLLSS